MSGPATAAVTDSATEVSNTEPDLAWGEADANCTGQEHVLDSYILVAVRKFSRKSILL